MLVVKVLVYSNIFYFVAILNFFFCPGQAKFEHFSFLGWVEIIQTLSKPCTSTLNVVYLVLCRGFIFDVNIVPRPCKLLAVESVLKVTWGLQSRHYRTVLLHQVLEDYTDALSYLFIHVWWDLIQGFSGMTCPYLEKFDIFKKFWRLFILLSPVLTLSFHLTLHVHDMKKMAIYTSFKVSAVCRFSWKR